MLVVLKSPRALACTQRTLVPTLPGVHSSAGELIPPDGRSWQVDPAGVCVVGPRRGAVQRILPGNAVAGVALQSSSGQVRIEFQLWCARHSCVDIARRADGHAHHQGWACSHFQGSRWCRIPLGKRGSTRGGGCDWRRLSAVLSACSRKTERGRGGREGGREKQRGVVIGSDGSVRDTPVVSQLDMSNRNAADMSCESFSSLLSDKRPVHDSSSLNVISVFSWQQQKSSAPVLGHASTPVPGCCSY